MVELPDPPTAGLVFASYPSSNLGPYDEVVLFLDVIFKGRPFQFAAFLYVTTDAAMAAGREMGGYPKKIARIEFLAGPDHDGGHGAARRPANLHRHDASRECGWCRTPTRRQPVAAAAPGTQLPDAPAHSQPPAQSTADST